MTYELNYEQDHSHTHCWEDTKPPCGQRIEHLKCCLCEKVNPALETSVIKKIIKDYGYFNNGCSCCANTNLKEELENEQ